jgi:MinD-like ATPase involved in chromosome partitioning or flagellar assembly
MSRIHFIGGEKGGVGKSVVARLLAQYWIDRKTPWTAFDTDRSHGALLRHYAEYAQPLEVGRMEDLDRVVEAATAEDQQVLVDLAAQSEQDLHRWITASGVLELASELGIEILFWHVMDDGKDSLELLDKLLSRYGAQAHCVVVLNHGRGESFEHFQKSLVAQKVREIGVPVVELPALHKPTMRHIDHYDKSFWAAMTHEEGPRALGLVERHRVKIWTRAAYAEFTKIGV